MTDVPSVGQLVGKIKILLEGQFSHEVVEGEISNLSLSSAGHWYFTLSDSEASLSCALFKMDALRNPILKKLKNGDKIYCQGSVGVYSKRGQFQLIAKRISLSGKGDLQEQFEKLKKKLASEGLFDVTHKKKIPIFPKRIAIITAIGGAALQDILNIIKRRTFTYDILISPAIVQGEKSAQSLRESLHRVIKYSLSTSQGVDLIILARGGGSMEDLWSFNDEGLAWDLFNCPIPIISAVGHEVDYSISDLVADLRVETPSAAAEVVTEFQVGLEKRLELARKSFFQVLNARLGQIHLGLRRYHPLSLIGNLLKNLQEKERRLRKLQLLDRAENYTGLNNLRMELDEQHTRLQDFSKEYIVQKKDYLQMLFGKLSILDPNNTLRRGYTYVQEGDGKLIEKKESFPRDKDVQLIFHDGKVVIRSSP